MNKNGLVYTAFYSVFLVLRRMLLKSTGIFAFYHKERKSYLNFINGNISLLMPKFFRQENSIHLSKPLASLSLRVELQTSSSMDWLVPVSPKF